MRSSKINKLLSTWKGFFPLKFQKPKLKIECGRPNPIENVIKFNGLRGTCLQIQLK